MSHVVDLHGFPGAHLRAAWSRDDRLLGIALAASVSVHLAAIAIAPGFRRLDEQPPRPLEVMIVRPAIPAPMKPRAAPKPPPPVAKPTPVVRQETQRKPAPTPLPEKKLLVLPEPAPSAPSVFSVPQASVEPAPPAPSAAAPAPAPAAPAREVASTPPSFNAAYLRNAPPRYPLIARRNGVEGTVRLKVFVSKDGRPTQVQLEQSSGSSALDNAALEAVRGWQFVPAHRGQDAIESWVLVPVVFKLESVS
jgi:protein TonB